MLFPVACVQCVGFLTVLTFCSLGLSLIFSGDAMKLVSGEREEGPATASGMEVKQRDGRSRWQNCSKEAECRRR